MRKARQDPVCPQMGENWGVQGHRDTFGLKLLGITTFEKVFCDHPFHKRFTRYLTQNVTRSSSAPKNKKDVMAVDSKICSPESSDENTVNFLKTDDRYFYCFAARHFIHPL